MKDFTVTKKRQKQEIISLLVSFVIGFGLNVYAVVSYHAPAKEIFTSIGFVVITTAVIYALWTLLRLIAYGTCRIFKKNKN